MSRRTRGGVVAVFAHPDDAELTCFGTLALLVRARIPVTILHLTRGERGRGSDPCDRVSEAECSAERIGAELVSESLSDGTMACDIEMISLVESHLEQLQPRMLITHYAQPASDGHQDHLAVSWAATNCARRHPTVSCIVHAEPVPTQNAFTPNVFVDITDVIGLKHEAIRLHKSERGKPYMDLEAVTSRARWWGLQADSVGQASKRYCEAFQLITARVRGGLAWLAPLFGASQQQQVE